MCRNEGLKWKNEEMRIYFFILLQYLNKCDGRIIYGKAQIFGLWDANLDGTGVFCWETVVEFYFNSNRN